MLNICKYLGPSFVYGDMRAEQLLIESVAVAPDDPSYRPTRNLKKPPERINGAVMRKPIVWIIRRPNELCEKP
jgi:hypothetical protein